MLLDTADAFGDQVAQYRSELLVHSYRMLGTIDEAEDAVQEALGRAWQGRQTFLRAISLRAWLYRIATNVCLNTIESRKRDRVSVGPGPDHLLLAIAPSETGPEARYDAHESISLAFLTVLQVLPPRQRAVLLLRDVLSFSASEVAVLLEMSVPAVNSALQRARATLRNSYAIESSGRSSQDDLLERYVRAWETADVDGLVALLREDAVLRMPPMPMVAGAAAIGGFLARTIFPIAPMRLVGARANGHPAFAAYRRETTGNRFAMFALLVITSDGRQITSIDAFSEQDLATRDATVAYARMYVTDSGRVRTDYQRLVACTSFGACRTAAQSTLIDLQTFQADRSGATVPSQIANSDAMLRDALSAAIAADQQLISGFDTFNVNQVTAGLKKLNAAMLSMGKAETVLGPELQ
jgi:RNA polymerase sigma-70 factor, ECF subfamily